jgi:hypothetical protein
VKTVEEAKKILLEGDVDEISLDHDLGRGESDAHVLVTWMIDKDLVPHRVTLHSWNPVGVMRMATALTRRSNFPPAQ